MLTSAPRPPPRSQAFPAFNIEGRLVGHYLDSKDMRAPGSTGGVAATKTTARFRPTAVLDADEDPAAAKRRREAESELAKYLHTGSKLVLSKARRAGAPRRRACLVAPS